MGSSAFILRHVNRRAAAAEAEVQRRALLSVARNTTLPSHVRHKAQLALSQANGGTTNGRMTSVKNLCNETGRARGVLSKYGLCRVSLSLGVTGERWSRVWAGRLGSKARLEGGSVEAGVGREKDEGGEARPEREEEEGGRGR